jgi:PAS domain S-box-containing protein
MYERFVLSLYVLSGLSIVFIGLAWRKRTDPGGTPMVVFYLALAVGAVAYARDITATTVGTQLLYRQIATVAQGTVAIAWLYAALQYANFDRSLTRRVVGVLSLDPLLLTVGFLVPGVTFFRTPPTGTTGSLLHAPATQLTPLFLLHMGTILVTALAGTLVLIQLFLRSRHLYRTQAAAVLVAALTPWTIALSQQYFLRIPEDATIFAWGISGVAMTAGLYTFKTLDPVPAAQSTIVETMGDGTVVLDVDGRISDINPAARALLDDGDTPVVGRHIGSVVDGWETLHESDHRDWAELSLTVDGDERFLDVETTSFTDRFDDEVGTLVVLRDITDRKRREQRLEQYKLIFDSVTEPVYVLDDDERIIRYNDPFADLVGCDETALVGEPITAVLGAKQAATDGGFSDRTETTVRTGSGAEVPCELDLAPVALDDGATGRVGIIRDISRRKAIESELAETTERLETLVEASPLAIIAHDTEGVVDVWNPAAESLFGWSADEVRGSEIPIVPAERETELLDRHARVQSGEHLTGWETELRHKDGQRVPAAVSAAPIRNGDGDVVGTVSIIADISERKARQRQLERQNERLGEFASLVSHDLRNPLQVASGHLALAKTDDGDAAAHIEDAEAALNRMETLIEDTLSLAKQGRDIGSTERTPLASLAERAWANVTTGGGSLTLAEPPTVDCDPDRVVELLENLFSNAITHGRPPGGDPITVTVGSLDGGFYVADDGTGIPENEADLVFESGFTTEDAGTGLGLEIVQTIADAHGWTVDVTESESGGARFDSLARGRARGSHSGRSALSPPCLERTLRPRPATAWWGNLRLSGMREVRDRLAVGVDAVDAGEADALELEHVVGLVAQQTRLGDARHVAVHRAKPEFRPVGGRPVDHVDVVLTDRRDVVADVLEGVAGVAHAAVPLQPDALAVVGQVLALDDDACVDRNIPAAPVLVVGVQRRFPGVGAADDLSLHEAAELLGLPDEESAVGVVVDELTIVGVHRRHREVDVRGGGPQVDHRLDQRLTPNAPPSEAGDRRRARVVPAVEFALGDEFADGRGRHRNVVLFDLDVAPMDDLGVLPAEVVVDESLAFRGVLQVDTADNMGDTEQVVVDTALEVEHRPAAIVGGFLAWVWRVYHPEGDEVPQRGVLVGDVGPDPQHHLAAVVLAVDHRLELFFDRLGVFLPVWTGLATVFQVREIALGTGACVGPAQFDELPGVVVVDVDPVARLEHVVGLEAEILDGRKNLVVGVEVRSLGLGVSVVEPADELAVVALLVGPDDGGHPRVADVPRAVGVRGDAHPHVSVLCVGQVRQRVVGPLVLALYLVEPLGGELGDALATLRSIHLVDSVDDRGDDARNLVAVLAELRVLAHERPHDGPDLCLAVVFDGIEEGVRLGGLLDTLAYVVVHGRFWHRPAQNAVGLTRPARRLGVPSDRLQ